MPKPKRRNVQDATLKNTRVLLARLKKLEARVAKMEAQCLITPTWQSKKSFKKGDVLTIQGGRMFTIKADVTGKRTDTPKDRLRAK